MEQLLAFTYEHMEMIYIVILSIILGIQVIESVPTVLHTPLMSGANAIHGVVVVGAIIVMGSAAPDNYVALILGFLAVVLGTVNVVGGFVVTDRMLDMFKKKPAKKD
ncbi:MAG: NAD(P) transhydrogenase subunit alpha [Flavobacteriales bacterium]|nr:NAD(P) transhydrogenase subunit alpha [Flavobacteriales bacterium]